MPSDVIRVLSIDDEAPIRLLVRVNLEMEGMTVLEAEDGQSGVAKAKEERPDVILLGVMMPGLDGWRVAEELQRDQETREIPIVFLTARATFGDRARGLGLGAVDYVTKPFNPVELAPRLRRVLGRLERGERDELRRETLSELPPLTALAKALQAQGAKMPRIPPEVLAAIRQQADAIAEMHRLVAHELASRGRLPWANLARDLLRHVSRLRLPPQAIDLEQERAVDRAAEEIRADASEFEPSGVDHGTRDFLRGLTEDERRGIRKKLAALILALADHVFDHLTEEGKGRSLVRVIVLYVLMALYAAVTRSIERKDEDAQA